MNGSGSRLVMSQPDATLYIQPPMFETTVAVHTSAKVRLRNGAHADAATGGADAVGLMLRQPARQKMENAAVALI
jgi:hypothetical protein